MHNSLNELYLSFIPQVWKQKKVWEGFIKCCQRTKPQSFQVLLQLPAPQLAEVFEECPDLRTPLLDHVMTFTDHQVNNVIIITNNIFIHSLDMLLFLPQKKHIPKTTMDVLLGNKIVIIDDETEYSAPSNAQELIPEIKKEPVDPSDSQPSENNTE